jgi:hypothetical protein
MRYGAWVVFIVAVNRHDTVVALLEAEGVRATKLRTQTTRSSFNKQATNTGAEQYFLFQRSVSAASVNDDNIGTIVELEISHPRQ